ncbi:MAG: hypothetical protein JF587_21295 [Catenulisporales bacterium]|nr:hypothetical protein [Catenulisporales bacterium]
MGSVRGDSAGDDTAEEHPPGEPPPIEVELLEDDADTLPEGKPNIAASGTETIGGSAGRAARLGRLGQLPRAMRVLGALAAAIALTITVWPNSAPRAPRPTPQPALPASTQAAVNADLYKVHLTGTSFDHQWRDHAVMGLVLVNDAPARLTVINAELWDALGTRIGVSTQWPAADIDAGSVRSVPLTLPYACNIPTALVLPVTIRYSVSSPQDLGVSHNYEYPLTDAVWNQFAQTRASVCGAGPEGGLYVDAVDARELSPNSHDRHGFDLVIAFDAVRQPGWTLERLSAALPGITVTTGDLPLAMASGRPTLVRTNWQFADCSMSTQWEGGASRVAGAVVTYSEGGGDAGNNDQQLKVLLRPELLTKMFQAACAR